MVTTNQICWVAGLLEGEGCFTLAKSGGQYSKGYNSYSPLISLIMCDLDVIRKFRSIVNVDNAITINNTSQASKRATHQFRISGNIAVQWMMTIYPLMGERRQQKIRELLCLWKNKKATRAKIRAVNLLAEAEGLSEEDAEKIYLEIRARAVEKAKKWLSHQLDLRQSHSPGTILRV